MTAALVLAAGVGRRLASVTDLPKWLLPIGADTPAAAQLDALSAHGIETVAVVVGSDGSSIEKFVEPWRDRLRIQFVVNNRAAEWNNWYSMLLGLEHVLGVDDSIVFLNSDLYGTRQWFAAALQALTDRTFCGAALVVDPTRGRTDEAMKVTIDESRLVKAIGKTSISAVHGEYVGAGLVDRAGAEDLRDRLAARLDRPDAKDDWYEHGIQDAIDGGVEYRAAAAGRQWVEIDDPDDLRAAEQVADRAQDAIWANPSDEIS